MGGSLEERSQPREPEALYRNSLQSCSHTAGGSSGGSLDSALAQGLWTPAARSRAPGPAHMNWYDSCLPDNYYDLYNPKEEDEMSADFWKIRACDAESKRSRWTMACENYEMAAQLLKQGLELGAEPREDLERLQVHHAWCALQDLSFRWKSTVNYRKREVSTYEFKTHRDEDEDGRKGALAFRAVSQQKKDKSSQEEAKIKHNVVPHASVTAMTTLHEQDCGETGERKQSVPNKNMTALVRDFNTSSNSEKPFIEVLPPHNHAASRDPEDDAIPVSQVLFESMCSVLKLENKPGMAKEDNLSVTRELGQDIHTVELDDDSEEGISCQTSRNCFPSSEQIFCKDPKSACVSEWGETASSPDMSEQISGEKAAQHINEGSGNWTDHLHASNATKGGSTERIKGILATLLARLLEVTIVQPETKRGVVDPRATIGHNQVLHQDQLSLESSVDTTEVVDRNCKAYSPMSVDEVEDDGDSHSPSSFFSYEQPVKLEQATLPCDIEVPAATKGILDHMPTSACYRQAHHITPKSAPSQGNKSHQSRIVPETPAPPVLHSYPFPGCGPAFGPVSQEDTIPKINPRVPGPHLFNFSPSPSMGSQKKYSPQTGYSLEGQQPGPYQLTLHAGRSNPPNLDHGGPSSLKKFAGHPDDQSDNTAGGWPAPNMGGTWVVPMSSTEAQGPQHYQCPQGQGMLFSNETGGKLLARANMYSQLQSTPPFFQPPVGAWEQLHSSTDIRCPQQRVFLPRMHQGYSPSRYSDCWGTQFHPLPDHAGDSASAYCMNPDPQCSMILPCPEWITHHRGEVRHLDGNPWSPQSHSIQSPHIQHPATTWRRPGSGPRDRGVQQHTNRGVRSRGDLHWCPIGMGWEHSPQWMRNMEEYSNQTPQNHHHGPR